MELILGTSNQGKVRELTPVADLFGVTLLPMSTLQSRRGMPPVVGEGGITYEENAILKAKAYAKWANEPVVTDDTGIEFSKLHFLPGVYTAGWGLVRTIQALGCATEHPARFVTVVAYAEPCGRLVVARGELHGIFRPPTLREAHALCNPLPFSPYFFPHGAGRSLEELTNTLEGKEVYLSHRGRAVRNLLRAVR